MRETGRAYKAWWLRQANQTSKCIPGTDESDHVLLDVDEEGKVPVAVLKEMRGARRWPGIVIAQLCRIINDPWAGCRMVITVLYVNRSSGRAVSYLSGEYAEQSSQANLFSKNNQERAMLRATLRGYLKNEILITSRKCFRQA